MIYLIDTTAFKIVFDRRNIGRALALSVESQAQLKEEQIAVLTGQKTAEELNVEGHPFQVSSTRINDKKAYEPILDKTGTINIQDIEWKVIKDEVQEGDVKYVEIV